MPVYNVLRKIRLSIPFCVTVAVAVWFISLLWLNFFYALGYALIHLASNLLGTYVVVLLISEYLNGKSLDAENKKRCIC